MLKSGNYVFTKDIEIDLNDSYFDDKRVEIERGIISHDNKDGILSIDGGNHKITFASTGVPKEISSPIKPYPLTLTGYSTLIFEILR